MDLVEAWVPVRRRKTQAIGSGLQFVQRNGDVNLSDGHLRRAPRISIDDHLRRRDGDLPVQHRHLVRIQKIDVHVGSSRAFSDRRVNAHGFGLTEHARQPDVRAACGASSIKSASSAG